MDKKNWVPLSAFDDPCRLNKLPHLSDVFKLSDMNGGTLSNDCKDMEDMMARLQKAYELLAVPRRRRPIFCPQDSEIAFLNRTVFPTLLPALSRTIQLAKLTNSLEHHLRSFNGIDSIVEYLWNNNPKHPLRTQRKLFHIPFVKKYLKKHPRKPYSKSIYFTDDEAASVIQAHIKGFLVRREPEVQEMRQFWKKLKAEKQEQTEKQEINAEDNGE